MEFLSICIVGGVQELVGKSMSVTYELNCRYLRWLGYNGHVFRFRYALKILKIDEPYLKANFAFN